MSDFLEIQPVEAELFHADERTGRQTGKPDEANSRFSQFCECAKIKTEGVGFILGRREEVNSCTRLWTVTG
jgi:hypothetical protein